MTWGTKILTLASATGLGLAVVGSSAGASAPTSLTGLSAPQVLHATLAAASTQRTATFTMVADGPGFSERIVTTSGARSGYRSETINGGRGDEVYANGVVYLRFDRPLMALFFRATDPTVVNRWMSLTKGAPWYYALSADVTFPSVLRFMHPLGPVTLTGSATINGVLSVGVTGNIDFPQGPTRGRETLYVSTAPPFLPVRMVIHEPSTAVGATITLTPKNWAAPIRIVVPRDATSIIRTSLG